MSTETQQRMMYLAALATGKRLSAEWDCAHAGILIGMGAGTDPLVPWNPADDDGDSFGLACDLMMTVSTGPMEATATTIAGALRGFFPRVSTLDVGARQAARDVILSAAAEHGTHGAWQA